MQATYSSLPVLLLLILQLFCSSSSGVSTDFDCEASVVEETLVTATIADLHQLCFGDSSSSSSRSRLKIGETKGSGLDALRQMIAINADGKLFVKSRIDRENSNIHCSNDRPCKKMIDIVREVDQRQKRLRFWIKDRNDNRPQFSEYRDLQIRENVLNSKLPLPKITDDDEGQSGRTTARIVNSSVAFISGHTVQSLLRGQNTDRPYLFVSFSIDYELVQNFSFVLVACDTPPSGQAPLCNNMTVHVVVTDENDNTPIFKKKTYELEVKEDVYKDRPVTVLTVLAEDADSGNNGLVRYSLQRNSLPDTFKMNSTTGELQVHSKLDASELSELLQLKVQATDSAEQPLSSEADIRIKVLDVNDHSPRAMIEPALPIPENNASYPIGYLTATDKDRGDNGKVDCRLGDTLQSKAFQLGANEGRHRDRAVYAVSSTRAFDREQLAIARLVVVCRDYGSPPKTATQTMTISIEDVNEYIPRFREQVMYATVPEGERNALVTQLNATDADATAQLTYSVLDDGEQLFVISGNQLRTRQKLDRERNERHVVVVRASDGERTATARVEVTVTDINDESPQFKQPLRFSIDETFGNSSIAVPRHVGRLRATDADQAGTDNAKISYRLSGVLRRPPGDGAVFRVEPDGVVTAAGKLDRESAKERLLVVVASDAGRPSRSTTATATVRLNDLNDNAPRIEQPVNGRMYNITDAYTPGVTVLRVRVHDADVCDEERRLAAADCLRNSSFRMRLRQRVRLFAVNSSTGNIVVLNALTPGVHSLNLSVSDSGRPAPLTSYVSFAIRVQPSSANYFLGPTWGSNANWTLLLIIIVASSFITIVLVVAIVLLNRRQPCYNGDTSSSSLPVGKQQASSSSSYEHSPCPYSDDFRQHLDVGSTFTRQHPNAYDPYVRRENGYTVPAAAPAYQPAACMYAFTAAAAAAAPVPALQQGGIACQQLGDNDVGSADSGHGASEEEAHSELRGHSAEHARLMHPSAAAASAAAAGLNRSCAGNYTRIAEEDCNHCHEHIPLTQHQASSSTFSRQQQQQMQQLPLNLLDNPNFKSSPLNPPDYRSLSRPAAGGSPGSVLSPIAGSRSATPQQLQQLQQQQAPSRV